MHDPFAALVAQGNAKIAAAAPQPLTGELLAPEPGAGLSPAHRAVLGALDELLDRVIASSGDLPPAARLMLTTVRSLRGTMVDGIARMPEEQLVGLLVGLRDRIDSAVTDGH